MAKRSEIELRPADELTPEEFAAIEAQEMFVVQAQHTINRLMRVNGVSQAELARRLGVSEARVSSMFGNDKNFTLRTIGKILHALGEEAMLTTTREFEEKGAGATDAEPLSMWCVLGDFEEDTDALVVERKSHGAAIDLNAWAANDMIYEQRLPARVLNS